METRSSHKLKQNNSTIIAGGDVVNGNKVVCGNDVICVTNNYYLTDEELYSKVTNKNDYAESYKKYINNFQELNNYAIDSFFSMCIK